MLSESGSERSSSTTSNLDSPRRLIASPRRPTCVTSKPSGLALESMISTRRASPGLSSTRRTLILASWVIWGFRRGAFVVEYSNIAKPGQLYDGEPEVLDRPHYLYEPIQVQWLNYIGVSVQVVGPDKVPFGL